MRKTTLQALAKLVMIWHEKSQTVRQIQSECKRAIEKQLEGKTVTVELQKQIVADVHKRLKTKFDRAVNQELAAEKAMLTVAESGAST